MSEGKPKKELPAVLFRDDFRQISDLDRVLLNGKIPSLEEVQDYACIQYDALVRALEISHKIREAEEKDSEAEKHIDDYLVYENASNPIFHGLVNYTRHDAFNIAPDRNKLIEFFKLSPDANADILDRLIIHFLVGAIFFQGMRTAYFGENRLFFQAEDIEKLEPENIEKTITESKTILDNCLDRSISYKQIEKSLYFLVFRGEFDYLVDLATRTLPLEEN